MKKSIASPNAPAAIGPYSQAVKAGNTLYLSGQIGMVPATGELVAGGVAEQTEQALKNMQAVLQQAGIGPDNVVKSTVFIVSMQDFSAVNAVYSKVFGKEAPARSCVAVKELPKGALVEIEAIAVYC